jgi:putative ABC transport system permease protein
MSKKHTPPNLFRKFLQWFCDPEIHQYIDGDLVELYYERIKSEGKRKANRRFVIDVILLFRPGIIKPVFKYKKVNQVSMLKNYLLIAWRSNIKSSVYSRVNIIGLAIGLAAFTLIALFVRHELSFDKHNSDVDRIFRVVRSDYTCSPPAMASTLKADIPEIQYSSRFIVGNNTLLGVDDKYFAEEEFFWTDNEFFQIFTFDFILGSARTILNNPTDIVISESIAKKYFGDKDPLGQTVIMSREHKFNVVGVFRDVPSNSHFHFNIVLPIERYFKITGNNAESWSGNYTYTYIKLHKDAGIVSTNEKLINIEKELVNWTPEAGKTYEQHFFFQPISDIHLNSHRRQEVEVNGDMNNVIIFSSIGLLILLIAGINYVNLTTALSGNRHKEVGMRKALGAKKGQLVNQFLIESIVIALIATIIATIMVIYSQSYFSQLMARDMSIGSSDIPFLLPALFLLAIAVGLIAGLIPSRSVSSVSTISIIRGMSGKSKGGKRLRNILVVLQFSIALVLIILSINVHRQLYYIVEKDPGYTKDQIITIKLFDNSIRKNIQSLKEELLTNANVRNVSTSYNLPHKINEFTRPEWFCDDPSDCTPISYNPVDYSFIELYDLEIMAGRNFSLDYPSDAQGAFLINETAARMAGWDSPIGMEISHYDGRKGNIVGVVKDFNFQSLHSNIAPLYLMLDEDVYSYMSIKLSSEDRSSSIGSIEKIFNKYSQNAPFQYTFFDDSFEQVYKTEKRLGSIFTFFAVLAILLGCLGLYGMSTFVISQKIKEIGVRKVLGATNMSVILLLGKKFLMPIIIANIIAWPFANFIINKWLESFAYKTDVSSGSFLLATAIVLIITLLTISLQSRKISRQTPSVSLKYE